MQEQTTRQTCCPECGSIKLYRDGFRYPLNGKPIQRWLCRDCGYRFSRKQRSNTLSDKNNLSKYASFKAKNLLKAIALTETIGKTARLKEGDKQDVKGKIVEFAWWLKKNGRSEATIKTWTILLRSLIKQDANLMDPESVKEAIAKRQCKDNSKRLIVAAYRSFAELNKIEWKPPHYKGKTKIPFIPLEREIDDLIACCSKKTATLLQLLKETGARLGEALRLKWIDLDSERRVVRIEPEKGSNPRVLKTTVKLLAMLNSLPKNHVKIFGNRTSQAFQMSLYRFRRKGAAKLQNPRILQITFHTLRHWKGTMEYHKTKDPWHVKKVLGHRSLKSTEVYINIDQAIFDEDDNDSFTVKVAEKRDEIKALLEVGFEYVCDKEGLMYFRKRK